MFTLMTKNNQFLFFGVLDLGFFQQINFKYYDYNTK